MRPPNLTNLLVGVGLLALLATFWLPTWSGRRAARVEDRALEVTIELLRTAIAAAPIDVDDRTAVAALERDLQRRCRERGHPLSDLPRLEPGDGPPLFGNRHYLFRIVRCPPPVLRPADWDSAARLPLESYGWPRTLLPPGRSVFLAPEWGRVAYTRNLGVGYAGRERMPEGGSGVPRQGIAELGGASDYRARSDERWLILPAELVDR